MSYPDSRRWVAKLCLSTWGETGFAIDALRRGVRHGPLNYFFIETVPAHDAIKRIDRAAGGRKDVLPGPAAAGARILARQRQRHVHLAEPCGQIALVKRLHAPEMGAHRLDQPLGKHRAPVATSLAVTHRDLAALESTSFTRKRSA